MKVIVDTNVPLTANTAAPQASPLCVAHCVRWLDEIRTQHVLVLDDGWHIISEYKHKLRSTGQPGVGDAFLKWVLTQWANLQRCELVHLTPQDKGQPGCSFQEYPQDPALAALDPSDRKFVAVAVTHPEHPPILNATDSDWWHHREALAHNHVRVECICPDAPFM